MKDVGWDTGSIYNQIFLKSSAWF